tara:strand:+ start:467 stop:637 length:171 start_codon:yes stop_codon:yes gene_type:complete
VPRLSKKGRVNGVVVSSDDTIDRNYVIDGIKTNVYVLFFLGVPLLIRINIPSILDL